MTLIPKPKQWKSWSLPSKLTAIGTFIAVLSFAAYLAESVYGRKNDSIDRKVELIYSELFDSSKQLLRDLQPSNGNIFRADMGTIREQIIFESKKQLIPLKLVEVLEVGQFGTEKGDYGLRLTNLGKRVRAYLLSHEPGPGLIRNIIPAN